MDPLQQARPLEFASTDDLVSELAARHRLTIVVTQSPPRKKDGPICEQQVRVGTGLDQEGVRLGHEDAIKHLLEAVRAIRRKSRR